MTVPNQRTRAPTGAAFLIERRNADSVFIPEDFDEELRLIAASARTFVEREIEPVFDELEHLSYELSRTLVAKAGDQGLLGVEVPEAYGGLGASKVAATVVTEALSRAGSFNVTWGAHSGIGTLPLVYFGTEEQKRRYLPKLASGEWVAAYCLTEPSGGSDSLAAKTRAVLDGDVYVLNGTKMWITNAGFADLFTVFAQVDGDKFSAFLVERGTPGLSVAPEEKKMGIKGSSTCQVILDDARVPAENLLGEVGKGAHVALGTLNLGRYKLAAGTAGGVKLFLEYAARYAQEREQFGSPIASFGLIQDKLGRMTADGFALESAVYRLAADMDAVLEGVAEGPAQSLALNEYVVEYSFIKVFGSEILDRVVDEALQIYGGYGYSADYPIELGYRNTRINRIFEGTNEINRLLTVEQLLKRAMRGELELMGPAQEALTDAPLTRVEAPEVLEDAVLAVENLKRATLAIAALGATAYMQELEYEQELMAHAADLTGLVYLAESALLRAERLQGSQRGPVSATLARLYAFTAIDRARLLTAEGVRRIPGGSEAGARISAYLPDHGVDLIGLRREAAQAAVDVGGYPL